MSESGYSSDESFNEKEYYQTELERFKKKYEIISRISSGNGQVFNGIEKNQNIPVVIKKLQKKKSGIPNEVTFHKKAQSASSGVIRLLEVFELKKSVILILEKPENSMDLLEIINQFGVLNDQIAFEIIQKVAIICQELENVGICHRDIKDENILFDPVTFEIKLIDFGSATMWRDVYQDDAGTSAFHPPEFYKTGYMQAAGLTSWSLGCLYYILLTGTCPFSPENPDFKLRLSSLQCHFYSKIILSKLLAPEGERIHFSYLLSL